MGYKHNDTLCSRVTVTPPGVLPGWSCCCCTVDRTYSNQEVFCRTTAEIRACKSSNHCEPVCSAQHKRNRCVLPFEQEAQGNEPQWEGQSEEKVPGKRSVRVGQLFHVFPGHAWRKPQLSPPHIREQVHSAGGGQAEVETMVHQAEISTVSHFANACKRVCACLWD